MGRSYLGCSTCGGYLQTLKWLGIETALSYPFLTPESYKVRRFYGLLIAGKETLIEQRRLEALKNGL